MSYYDSSTLTKRKQNKVISNNFLNRLNSNNLSYGSPLGISSASIINNVKTGNMKNIVKCNGSFNINDGCPCIPSTNNIQYTPENLNLKWLSVLKSEIGSSATVLKTTTFGNNVYAIGYIYGNNTFQNTIYPPSSTLFTINIAKQYYSAFWIYCVIFNRWKY